MWLVGLTLVLPVLALGSSSTPDTEMLTALQESFESDELVISIKNIKPRKRKDYETLLALYGSLADRSFAIKMDKSKKSVILETAKDKKYFRLEALDEKKVINDLVLQIVQKEHKSVFTLYIDCQLVGTIELEDTLLNMFHPKLNPLEKVYRRFNTDLDSNTSIKDVLSRLHCDNTGEVQATQPQPASEIEDTNIPGYNRGDIPIIHDCDDNLLIKSINELIALVKRLNEDLEAQRIETKNLRHLLEQCDICRPGEGY